MTSPRPVRVRYFNLNVNDDIDRIPQARMEGAWQRQRPFDNSTGRKPLRIISVIVDDSLMPLRGFVTRLTSVDGWITRKSWRRALVAYSSLIPGLIEPRSPRGCHDAARLQLKGWPEPVMLMRKLAVVLDVPIADVPDVYFGGPLLLSSRLDVSVKQALSYYRLDD